MSDYKHLFLAIIFFPIYILSSFSYAFIHHERKDINSNYTATTTINFSNLNWYVRDGKGGPGPNNWSKNNAFVDGNGWLHLKITNVNGKWYCPEIYTVDPLGFGQYWFYIIGKIDNLDPNIVLGLFNYTTPNVGPDGTNEIDIEFSRWGDTDPSALNVDYTVWPAIMDPKRSVLDYYFNLPNGTYSTHGFTWSAKKIYFQSGMGHYNNYVNPIMSWSFEPPDYINRIPQKPIPLHINLWLLNGNAPSNGQAVEVIIKKFCFQPANGGPGNCPTNP